MINGFSYMSTSIEFVTQKGILNLVTSVTRLQAVENCSVLAFGVKFVFIVFLQ